MFELQEAAVEFQRSLGNGLTNKSWKINEGWDFLWTYCVLGKVRFFNDINHTVDASRSEFLGTVTFAGTHLGSSDTITWILQYQGKALLAKYLSYFLCQTYHKIVLVDSCDLCRHPLSLWGCTNSSHLGDLTDQAYNLLLGRCHPQSWSQLVNPDIFQYRTFACFSLVVASIWTFLIWFLLFLFQQTKFPRRWSPVRFPGRVPVECPRLPEHLLG